MEEFVKAVTSLDENRHHGRGLSSKLVRFVSGNSTGDENDMSPSITNELTKYLGLKAAEADQIVNNAKVKKSDRLLTFWNEMSRELPTISKLARRLLCVPASSSPVERLFKFAKKNAYKERAQLSAETQSSLVMSIAIGKFLDYKNANNIE